MTGTSGGAALPLPKGWTRNVKSAVLHAISLGRQTFTYTRSWAADSPLARVRLAAKVVRLEAELAVSREWIRILLARMAQILPRRRPNYPPEARLAILELKASQGWSLKQTAKNFQVTPATIATWMKRLDEDGPEALVQLPVPVNRFPDYVRYVIRRFKTLCPTMGKVKIAETLARAGLHLGATTVGRMLKRKPRPKLPTSGPASPEPVGKQRIVTAKYPNHVWHVDLTVAPTGGFWTPWFPFALPQSWPFCHWVAVVVDHFSRRIMAATAFKEQPTSEEVRSFLGRAIAKVKGDNRYKASCAQAARTKSQPKRWKTAPKYIVCDKGPQFDCPSFRQWCKRKGIQPPRYGAIGKHGSVAVVERAILTVKCLLSRLLLIPYRRDAFLRELAGITDWYNEHRPHAWLDGRTPNEVYYARFPANRKPRFETRSRWPRGSTCARPWALVRGSPGAKLTLDVSFHKGKKHLPIVTIRRAA